MITIYTIILSVDFVNTNRINYDLTLRKKVYKIINSNDYDLILLLGGIKMRVNITLQCTETGDRNYITTKNKRNNPDRLELMKYSPRLKRKTLHRETK
jgi:large subunit ribosomal protein L33